MNKKCMKCGLSKPQRSFFCKKLPTGKIKRTNLCSICRKAMLVQWYISYKKQLKCSCGFNDYRALDFDHINGKTMNVSKMIQNNCLKKDIVKEIAKCQVLCSNCHRIKTYEDIQRAKNTKLKKVKIKIKCKIIIPKHINILQPNKSAC